MQFNLVFKLGFLLMIVLTCWLSSLQLFLVTLRPGDGDVAGWHENLRLCSSLACQDPRSHHTIPPFPCPCHLTGWLLVLGICLVSVYIEVRCPRPLLSGIWWSCTLYISKFVQSELQFLQQHYTLICWEKWFPRALHAVIPPPPQKQNNPVWNPAGGVTGRPSWII